MDANRQAQTAFAETPLLDPSQREPDRLDALLQEIAADARARADRYAEETRVPEGGE